jgi:hypothetical protein
MSTKFGLFLNEGLIKLPPKLTDHMIKYFVYWYLCYVEGIAAADKSYEEDDQDMIKVAIDRMAKKYGVNPPKPTDVEKTKKTRAVYKNFPVEDLPPSYLERVAKVKGTEAIEELKKAHVKFLVSFRQHPKIDMDGDAPQGIFYAEPAEIIISIPNMHVKVPKMIQLLSQFNHAEAGRSIDHTLGIVEHEITHAVQAMVLHLLHPSQYDPNREGRSARGLRKDQAKQDKYYTSDLEFDPWVKTSIRELKNIFSKAKATSAADKKALFTYFTYGDVQPKGVSKADDGKQQRSAFFKALRRSDPDKWKKAVKLLSQETL